MSTSQPTIAIVGAGIGGLAVSACLRKRGIETTIYEQAPAFARIGAGIQMSPNAMRVLYGIGVGEFIRRTAFEPPHWRNRDYDTGNLTNDHPLGPDAFDRYGVPYILMHRGDLHAALHGAGERRASLLGGDPVRRRRLDRRTPFLVGPDRP